MSKPKKTLASVLTAVMLFQMLPSFHISSWADEEKNEPKVISLDEAMEQGLVQDFIEKPEQTAYTAEDVLFEYTDLRTDETKSFRLANGNTLAVAYGYPVHYLDAEGKYQDIDNRLMLYNPDGTVSTDEPDSILNAWLEEQAELAAREDQDESDPNEETEEEQSPVVEPPDGGVSSDGEDSGETPPDEDMSPDGDTPPDGESGTEEPSENDDSSGEETPSEGDETDTDSESGEAGGENDASGESEEVTPTESGSEATEIPEETAEENTDNGSDPPEEQTAEEETPPPEETGLGDIPEDLPA